MNTETTSRPAVRELGFALGLSLITLVLGAGCARILGLEEATCDPRFSGCPGFEVPDAGDRSDPDSTGTDSTDTDSADAGTEDPIETEDQSDGSETTPPEDAGSTEPTDEPEAGAPTDEAPTDEAPTDGAPTDEPVPTPEELREAPCKDYCDAMEANCSEGPEQYANTTQCLALCRELMVSELESETPSLRNSIECRLGAARAAAFDERDLNCASAGLLGGDVCGTGCEVYCDMLAEACPTQHAAFGDCETECQRIPRVPEETLFSSALGSGNTLECRVNHIRLAINELAPPLHCPHAAGASPCAD